MMGSWSGKFSHTPFPRTLLPIASMCPGGGEWGAVIRQRWLVPSLHWRKGPPLSRMGQPGPNPQDLRMWPYWEIGPLQIALVERRSYWME